MGVTYNIENTPAMNIPERYLHFIWKYRLFRTQNLKTTLNETIKITDLGELNQHEGPDFLNVSLLIHEKELKGHVEIHVRASDWLKHQHDQNHKYNQVILHVVYEADVIYPKHIPLLELKPFINEPLFKLASDVSSVSRLQSLLPCASSLPDLSYKLKINWIKKLGYKRMLNRSGDFKSQLKVEDFDKLILIGAARAVGYSQNVTPMEKLMASLSLEYLNRFLSHDIAYRNELFEAILIVQSGLLDRTQKTNDLHSKSYIKRIEQLYEHSELKRAVLLEKSDWNFFRLRPANFPTIRLAGVARLLARSTTQSLSQRAGEIIKHETALSKILPQLIALFKVQAEGYWKMHYQFGKMAKSPLETFIGEARAYDIVINVLLPVMLLMFKQTRQPQLYRKVWKLYRIFPNKGNAREIHEIANAFDIQKVHVNKAFIEQGIVELKKNYCKPLNCLECAVGKALLRK